MPYYENTREDLATQITKLTYIELKDVADGLMEWSKDKTLSTPNDWADLLSNWAQDVQDGIREREKAARAQQAAMERIKAETEKKVASK
jgi:hypothetical protein